MLLANSPGWGLPAAVDSYIEVLYGDRAKPSVAYINDCRWFGLAIMYLPHKKLLMALCSLAS